VCSAAKVRIEFVTITNDVDITNDVVITNDIDIINDVVITNDTDTVTTNDLLLTLTDFDDANGTTVIVGKSSSFGLKKKTLYNYNFGF
jgi:hypothetical protein